MVNNVTCRHSIFMHAWKSTYCTNVTPLTKWVCFLCYTYKTWDDTSWEGVQEEWCLIDKSECTRVAITWKCWVRGKVWSDTTCTVWWTHIHSKRGRHPYAQTSNSVHTYVHKHYHTVGNSIGAIFTNFIDTLQFQINFYYSQATRFRVNDNIDDFHHCSYQRKAIKGPS